MKRPPPRGRGRPVEFGPGPRAALLDLVRGGLTVAQACARAGVSRATVYRHRDRDEGFGAALRAATTAASAVRAERRDRAMDHCGTEARYVKAGCRCGDCTAAATKARTARAHAARGTEEEPPQGRAVPVPLLGSEVERVTVLRRAG